MPSKLGSGRKVSLNRLCGQDGSHITNRGESKTHPLERSVGGYPRALSISLTLSPPRGGEISPPPTKIESYSLMNVSIFFNF